MEKIYQIFEEKMQLFGVNFGIINKEKQARDMLASGIGSVIIN
jgi:hypothetical protein